MLISFTSFGADRATALPVITPNPHSVPSAAPSATTTFSKQLPYNSGLVFVLEDPISSTSSKANQTVRIRLKQALVVGGHTIAPAGTAGAIRILAAQDAQIGDVYGFVDIYFEPLALPQGGMLPLRAPIARLTINLTSGHASTVGIEDTVADAVVPYHFIYHIFRKGKNFELPAGTDILARTQAAIALAPDGSPIIEAPAPFAIGIGTPHASFSASPLATPGEFKERPPIMTPTPMGPGYPKGEPSPD